MAHPHNAAKGKLFPLNGVLDCDLFPAGIKQRGKIGRQRPASPGIALLARGSGTGLMAHVSPHTLNRMRLITRV